MCSSSLFSPLSSHFRELSERAFAGKLRANFPLSLADAGKISSFILKSDLIEHGAKAFRPARRMVENKIKKQNKSWQIKGNFIAAQLEPGRSVKVVKIMPESEGKLN